MPVLRVRGRGSERASGRVREARRELNRWFHRQRPRIAVAAAFAIAGLLGLIAASVSLETLGAG